MNVWSQWLQMQLPSLSRLDVLSVQQQSMSVGSRGGSRQSTPAPASVPRDSITIHFKHTFGTMTMEALKELGIPGPEVLRHQLNNCSDPLEAIASFQNENGILLASLRPMLPLLDLHGVRRLEFHTSVRDELKERMLQQVENLGKKDVPQAEKTENEKRLRQLLEKYFPAIRVPSIQPIIMAILKNLDHVDDKYLKQLTADKSLYEKCDIVVKRQIWQEHQGLFGDEVSPLLSQYIKEKEKILLNHEESTASFFTFAPKKRRENQTVQKLVKMVGKNVLLYDTILQFLRTLFLRTKNVHYCTLRVELLMALHDADIQDITAMDPCHKFAWCLDACIREQNIDTKRFRELQEFLDSIKKNQKNVLGDLSMTLCDHYAINFLANFCIRILRSLIEKEATARENQVLHLALRMLNLGLHSWNLLDTQNYEEPKFNVTIVTKFIPTLMSFMVDDQVRALNLKLPLDEREASRTVIEHSGPPEESFVNFVTEDALCALMTIYYTFVICKQKDKKGIMRILGTLSTSHESRAFENPFLHNLVSYLINMAEEFSDEDFTSVVFDGFLVSGIMVKNTAHHLMKLLWHVYRHLPTGKLESIRSTLQLCQLESEHSRQLYKSLTEKIDLTDKSEKQANEK